MRDGQAIQAWLVDAETAELHPWLSNGQRQLDLDVVVRRAAVELLDVAARLRGRGGRHRTAGGGRGRGRRYEELWALLHEDPSSAVGDVTRSGPGSAGSTTAASPSRRSSLRAAAGAGEKVRLTTAVAGRTFHADELQALTGLDVGEGQAAVLLKDLQSIGTGYGASGGVVYPTGGGSALARRPSHPGPSRHRAVRGSAIGLGLLRPARGPVAAEQEAGATSVTRRRSTCWPAELARASRRQTMAITKVAARKLHDSRRRRWRRPTRRGARRPVGVVGSRFRAHHG